MLPARMMPSKCPPFASKKQPLDIELNYVKCMEGHR